MIVGAMRVKNEARWIERCVSSILPVCDRVIVLDDHSDDGTPFICASLPRVTVVDSPFAGLNETRDKNHLLSYIRQTGAEWVLMIDGDEMLEPGAAPKLAEATRGAGDCFDFKILYLWDSEEQIRTDGVYGRFRRPSLFRLKQFEFQSTHAGGNFHCGNVPLAQQRLSRPLDAALLHFGYMLKADRIRKYHWYNSLDGANPLEDGYRHVAQGDLPELPASAHFRHAGPLQLEALCRAA